MATRLQVRQQVLRVLGDENNAIYSADLVNDGINEALNAILPWLYKPAVATITGDGTAAAFLLPVDFYRMIGVLHVDEGRWVPGETFSANQPRVMERDINQNWMQFPNGYITFANIPELDDVFKIHYGASWTKPTSDVSTLETPEWAVGGIVYFAGSYALIKEATNAANVRQWNINIDSGTPVMNPMSDMSEKLFRKFVDYMNMHPAKPKGAQ